MKPLLIVAAAAALALAPATAIAEGNLAAQPTTLELFIDGRNLTFSNTEYQIETGKYYRWEMTSDGIEEVMIRAPDLFRNSWINQIIINDLEVHTSGAIYGIEFDDEGTVVLFFVPIRPGNYEFFVPGFEDRGLSGTFVVR
jgi:hypothetical protein